MMARWWKQTERVHVKLVDQRSDEKREKSAHLISGVGHVGFGTFIRAGCVIKLHVEQIEDEAI